MNYKFFLNKNNKFKNKNRYRLESNYNSHHKNSHGLLFFSLASVAILTASIFLFLDENSAIDTDVAKLTLPSSAKPSAAKEEIQVKSIPLQLPEIVYHSETISSKTIASETVSSERVPSTPLEAKTSETTKTIPLKPVLEITVHTIEPEKVEKVKATKVVAEKSTQSISKQQINNDVTANLLKKVSGESDSLKPTNSLKPNTVAQKTSTTDSQTKTIIVKSGDTLSAIFKRASLSARTLHHIVNSSKQAKKLTHIKPGQKLIITLDNDNQFQSLSYDLDRIDTLIVSKKNDKYVSRIDSKEIDVQQQFASGIITNSLFASGYKAGLNSAMIMRLAQLFGWDVDFALDIRKGDSFAVLFEEKYIDGKKIGNGNILSAEFTNRGKTFRAIRYTDASGYTDYYSEKGLSMRKAFLRTPVEFSRISSRFSSGRKHPVLNRIRAHKGVDYAAARGTPIKAVGNGKVIYKGKKGGYGRVIILQHGSKYTTLYAHMNSYNRKVKRGGRVQQGQIIGYVGSSGLATGPHLHYEFRMNGVHRNPLTVPLPSASPIAKKYRNDFKNVADTLVSQLKLRKQETIALTEQ
ncbi:peptidoglycan DD-metalloendopeptidase family protein [sulfur-oxidizing endosymbiont of Gigantopelta aegis]|uniref:peptidoglycan DD-metalloendopeptidase family protein n=1 Tax=sulfur-oxidizing endosymbiont of Gigantopelta aegis TaxID=2794934 RepID=UPI0018DD147A|nr:peptidoglycan DD-metalloendopeptidase family protein [sulfur-oxidizing endosymbiont of Gigantopelta aegis]